MDFERAVLHRLLLTAVEEPAVLKSEHGSLTSLLGVMGFLFVVLVLLVN